MAVSNQPHDPGLFSSEKSWYPLDRRLGGS